MLFHSTTGRLKELLELIMSANTHHTKLKGDIAVAAVILNLTKKGYIVSEPMSENAPYDLICDTGNKLLKIQVKYRKDGIIPHRTSWADKNGTHTSNIDTSKIDYFALVNEDYSKICYPISTLAGCKIKWELPDKSQSPFYYYEDFLNFEFNKIPKRTSKINKTIIKNNRNLKEIKKRVTLSSEISKETLLEAMTNCSNKEDVLKILNISNSSYNRLYKLYDLENEFEYKKFIDRVNQIRSNNLPISKTKIEWPSKEELEKLLWEKPTTSIAKDLGVSDKAVEKHVKKLGLTKPPRGYWAKQKEKD